MKKTALNVARDSTLKTRDLICSVAEGALWALGERADHGGTTDMMFETRYCPSCERETLWMHGLHITIQCVVCGFNPGDEEGR